VAERDSLWLASSILGAAVTGDVRTRRPQDSWPLAPPHRSDLDWLRMGDGKRVVWELIQLAAAGDRSIFAKVVAEVGRVPRPALPSTLRS